MKEIPYHRPYPLNHQDKSKIHARLNEVLFSGQLTNGRYVEKLEGKIKEMYDVKYVLATSSCTMGLMICLEFIPKEYYIQVPRFNWWSDLYLLQFLKKEIYWNDIDKDSWLPIEAYGGYSLYLNTFGNIGESKRGEKAIYDSSHCLGVKLREIGLATVFSLAPTKLITSCEGGLIITNNEELYEFAKERRDRMSRMSEINAIIGLQTLEHLDEILKWKKTGYHYYNAHLEGDFQKIPLRSNYNTIAFLNTEGYVIPEHIETKQYYHPLADIGIQNNVDYVYENIIALPSGFGVDYEKIVEDIKNAV